MKVTALLTGRGNNTLKDKNILDLFGKPVLHYPAKAGRLSQVVNEWYCSSDDEKILLAAEKEGYQRIVRPDELARPDSQHIECILHALDIMENKPDILIVILANNVTVKTEWITDCVNMMKNDMKISAVVPVYEENDLHPLRAKTLNADGSLSPYVSTGGKISTNRQELPTCYFLSHNFWVLNVKSLLSDVEGQAPWTFMGNNIHPYVVDESIDIHEEWDLIKAKLWLEENGLAKD